MVSGSEKLYIGILTLINSALSIFSVAFALFMSKIIDSAADHDKNLFKIQCIYLGIIIAVQLTLRAILRRLDEKARADLENIFKRRTYKTVLTRDYSSLSVFHTGELLNRMTSDTNVIADGMVSILPNVTAMLVKLAGAFIVLIMLDKTFALIFIIGGILMIFVTYLFRKIMKKLHKTVQETDGKLRSFLQETAGSIIAIRSFGTEKESEKTADIKMAEHKSARMKKNLFSNICNIGFGIIMNGGYFFGLVWCGSGILNGSISYGTLTAVLQLIGQIQQPFANVTSYLPKYYAMLASAERLCELENLDEDNCGQNAMTQAEADELYSRLDSIELKKVTFSYPNNDRINEPVLENAEISVSKGDFTAIMGQSGIGKSTMLKLLLAVYRAEKGEINFIEKNGNKLPVNSQSRRMFAYVPQGNFLMSGTIEKSICFMGDNPDRKKLISACKIACADEFIENLPKKYDTVIGEKGSGLSEGQIQRIAIARAVYSDAPILLLDEATSALDELTEEMVLKNLKEMTDKTVIIVTHRKAALNVCNKIITLHNGKFIKAKEK